MKLRCYPGCLAEFVDGLNKGRRVIVDSLCEGATLGFGFPVWHIRLVQPLIDNDGTLLGMDAGLQHVADHRLKPVDPLDEHDEVDESTGIPATT